MTNDQVNCDSRVDAFVAPGCSLNGYIDFVTRRSILDSSQIDRFVGDIREIEDRAEMFRKANYWQQVIDGYFSLN